MKLPAVAIWHDIECGSYTADLSVWRELIASVRLDAGTPCELLEIGSGTGRVSLALAGLRCHVTAVDIDNKLVEVLRHRAAERNASVDAIVADARSLELASSFDLVLAPMQVAQLLGERDRVRMLSSMARHLRAGGYAAVALLDLDEEWDEQAGPLPPPDRLSTNGCDYSSQPVAVRRIQGRRTLRLDSVRRVTSPDGEQTETFSRICLELVSPSRLEAEGKRAGLVPGGRRHVPATEEHVGSTIVVFRHPDG